MNDVLSFIESEIDKRKAEHREPAHVLYKTVRNKFGKAVNEELSRLRSEGKITCGRTINDFYIKTIENEQYIH